MTTTITGSRTVPGPNRTRHLSLDALERGFRDLAPSPSDEGVVAFLLARPDVEQRLALDQAHLTTAGGVAGDRWAETSPERSETQLSTMQLAIAELIANGQPLALFGDNLILDLDLSAENLPTGSKVQAGSALLEVTPEPHDGCIKFSRRFGNDALRFTAHSSRRHYNLRGIYLTTLEDGDVAIGDVVKVLSRP